MKMVKSLLLGSAAGVVAVTTGQAADLPVKAKPVEYVKVCSLYGAGFFYIPGTDKCIKIGGLFREQWDIHSAGDGQAFMNTQGRWTRTDTSDSAFRTRSVLTLDVREQSAYGTIRGYTAFGAQQTTGSDTLQSGLFFNRGFVQFAGFTGGRAVSFFDFISFDPYGLANNIRPNLGNTGATGLDVFAYTAQLGNGVSFTASAEDACASFPTGTGAASSDRGCLTINSSIVGSLGVGAATQDNAGYNQPDIVLATRVDQAWGSAQVMGAVHRVAGGYYSTTTAFNQNNGHPNDREGWAVGAGFILNNVLGMKGDQFGVQANYTQGAVAYLTNGTGATQGFAGGAGGVGNSVTWGHVVDGIFSSGGIAGSPAPCGPGGAGVGTVTCGSGIELTTGWTVGGFYEHHWTPQWKTSVYGGYVSVSYDNTAAFFYCGAPRGAPATATGAFGAAMTAGSSCDPNMSFWSLGSRTMWNPNSNLDLGVDVVWNNLHGGSSGFVTLPAQGARPAGLYHINSDYNVWVAALRAQYNFLP